MDDSDQEVSSFGAGIGRRLAAAKTSAAQPAIAIKMLVEAVLAQHPTVKLPELVADAEVRHWLEARKLADGHLRQALTEARRALRANRDENVTKRPRRSKRKTSESEVSTVRSAADLVSGAIPNLPLNLL